MTKFKVGDKVRITGLSIFGANHIGELGAVKQVDTLLCTGGYGLYVVVDGLSRVYEYSAVDHASTKNQRITTLESEVAELKAKVEALEKAQSKPKYTLDGLLSQVKPSPNEQRKAIISEAKAFIEDVTKRMASDWLNTEGNVTFRYCTTKPEFHVNSKKRTVVALVKGLNGSDRELYEKAIAKCAPDDVFNADIGKAIALCRALGLDVSRFEQAVKPTEVVVGHVIRNSYTGSHRTYTKTVKSIEGSTVKYATGGWDYDDIFQRKAVILDDTEAKY